jgi:hypothetical protein
MTLFAKLLERFSRKESKVLGRWAVESCNKKINSKIDWSNTDHCGPCGTEIVKHTIYSKKITKNAGCKAVGVRGLTGEDLSSNINTLNREVPIQKLLTSGLP